MDRHSDYYRAPAFSYGALLEMRIFGNDKWLCFFSSSCVRHLEIDRNLARCLTSFGYETYFVWEWRQNLSRQSFIWGWGVLPPIWNLRVCGMNQYSCGSGSFQTCLASICFVAVTVHCKTDWLPDTGSLQEQRSCDGWLQRFTQYDQCGDFTRTNDRWNPHADITARNTTAILHRRVLLL